MGITDSEKVDIVASRGSNVRLYAMDSLNWDDLDEHLMLLQAKLNTYISYVESGEVYEHPSVVSTARVEIVVSFFHAPPQRAVEFLDQVKALVQSVGIPFDWETNIGTEPL
jgi:response regulator RpfG family c-di-GMP phosphodiesterase